MIKLFELFAAEQDLLCYDDLLYLLCLTKKFVFKKLNTFEFVDT